MEPYNPKAYPIIIWSREDGHIVVDGHLRLKTCKQINLSGTVPVVLKSFANEDEALGYAIRCQRDRRNLTDAELLSAIAELDKRKTRGSSERDEQGKMKPITSSDVKGRSSQATAEVLGISSTKVEKARTVLDKATPEVKEAVESGEMSINMIYNMMV